jgi:hypothetical protein
MTWLAQTPSAVVLACHKMLTRLEAEEAIMLGNAVALGFGNMKDPEVYQRHLTDLARGQTTKRPLADASVLTMQGFKFVTVPPAKKAS